MINYDCNYISAPTIDSAWRESISLCVRNGVDYKIEGGSYIGQIRRQLPYFVAEIKTPWVRPLAPITPPGIPPVTSDDKIESYFARYLMSSEKSVEEQYTYGEYICKQVPRIIELLNFSNGNTNQATICIGDTLTTFLNDPPCLRSLSFKVYNGKLQLCLFFRSWDLIAGFPENLGGLQLVKEYILGHLNFSAKDGSIIAMSDGLHLYSQYNEIVNALNVEKIC